MPNPQPLKPVPVRISPVLVKRVDALREVYPDDLSREAFVRMALRRGLEVVEAEIAEEER